MRTLSCQVQIKHMSCHMLVGVLCSAQSHFAFACRMFAPINPDTAEACPPCSPCQTQHGSQTCNSKKFKASLDTLIHTNHQEIRIQEDSKTLPVGSVPRSICVLLQDDLADSCQTGGEHDSTTAAKNFAASISAQSHITQVRSINAIICR